MTSSRGIKGYKNVSGKRLLSAVSKPKTDNERLKKIKEDLNKSRHKFSKSEIREIRKNLYKIESKKNISTQKIKEIEKSLSMHDYAKYIGIRDVGNLFNQSTGGDYYKPKKPKVLSMVIISNMKAMEIKTKIYQLKNISVWSDHNNIINDHKIPKILRFHSSNEVKSVWRMENSINNVN